MNSSFENDYACSGYFYKDNCKSSFKLDYGLNNWMTKTLSYKHALNAIKLMYEHKGFMVGEHSLGQQVYSEFGRPVADSHLGALYAFVDEQLALLRMVAWYFTSGMTTNSSTAIQAKVFHQLTIAHMRTLASVRMLCSIGFDINARYELRKLYENSVLWTRLRLDKDALSDFLLANTADGANKFWHQYLAKEKSEKYIDQALQGNQFWLGRWPEMVASLKANVGPAAHPSFLASHFDAKQDFADAGDLLILSTADSSSHFTLCHAITWAAVPFSLLPEPSYNIECTDFLEIGHPFNCLAHLTKSWDEYCANVRAMIPSLMVMAVRFGEGLANKKVD